MLKLLAVLVLVALVAAEKKSFEDYKVFRIVPTTDEQIELLQRISESSESFSFWNGPSVANASADLMVAPEKIQDFKNLMEATGTEYATFVENVQTLIDAENPPSAQRYSQQSRFDWTSYHTLEEIYAFLDSLAATYPDKVQTVIGGKTYEGRQIKGVKVSFKSGNPGIFLEGGIHAREWIAPATVTYILNELLTSDNPEVRALAEANDWYIFPVFNPDGFVYTHTNVSIFSIKIYKFCTHAAENIQTIGMHRCRSIRRLEQNSESRFLIYIFHCRTVYGARQENLILFSAGDPIPTATGDTNGCVRLLSY